MKQPAVKPGVCLDTQALGKSPPPWASVSLLRSQGSDAFSAYLSRLAWEIGDVMP